MFVQFIVYLLSSDEIFCLLAVGSGEGVSLDLLVVLAWDDERSRYTWER